MLGKDLPPVLLQGVEFRLQGCGYGLLRCDLGKRLEFVMQSGESGSLIFQILFSGESSGVGTWWCNAKMLRGLSITGYFLSSGTRDLGSVKRCNHPRRKLCISLPSRACVNITSNASEVTGRTINDTWEWMGDDLTQQRQQQQTACLRFCNTRHVLLGAYIALRSDSLSPSPYYSTAVHTQGISTSCSRRHDHEGCMCCTRCPIQAILVPSASIFSSHHTRLMWQDRMY
jgi:hypothetical protein